MCGLFILYDLPPEHSWPHSGASCWFMELCSQGRWVWVQAQRSPLPEKISRRVLRLCFLGQLRMHVHLQSEKTKALWRFRGSDLGAVHTAPRTAATLNSLPRVCMLFLLKGGRMQRARILQSSRTQGFEMSRLIVTISSWHPLCRISCIFLLVLESVSSHLSHLFT